MRTICWTVVCFSSVALGLAQKVKVPVGAGSVKDASDFVISTRVSLVVLDVAVKDKSGTYVSGLGKDDFQIYEDHKLQQVTHFSHADTPVTVGLVVDTSGSMRPKRATVITAALAFIQASNPKDEIFIVNFNDKVRPGLPLGQSFSDHIPTLRTALWMGNAEGRTALYDALDYSLKHLEQGKMDRRTLVLVSDGGDNASSTVKKQLLREIEESRTTVYAIGIFEENDPDKNPALLRQLSSVTGGDYYEVKELSDVLDMSRKIASDIRSRYTLAYAPPPSTSGHGIRTIKVTAAANISRQPLSVRTRTRYSIPDTP